MTNDDMLQKIKYYMVLCTLFFLFKRLKIYLRSGSDGYVFMFCCSSLVTCLMSAVPTGAFECEAAACCHLLCLKPYLE